MSTKSLPAKLSDFRWNRWFRGSDWGQAVLFLLPSFSLITIAFFYPILVNGITLSFKSFTLSPNVADPWVGLANYEYWLMGEGTAFLIYSTKITLLYVLVVMPLNIVVALGAAMIVNESLPARPLWRGLMLAGYASPAIAAGLVFSIMESNASYGILYHAFDAVFEMPQAGGLPSNKPWAFWGLVVAQVWRDFGFMYLIILAGLQSVPSELYEISKVDGAGPIQRFRYITLPHIRPVLFVAVIIRLVSTATDVDIPLAVTNGGPGNFTAFWGITLFKRAFISWNLGRGAAFGILMTIVLIPFIAIWLKLETEDFE